MKRETVPNLAAILDQYDARDTYQLKKNQKHMSYQLSSLNKDVAFLRRTRHKYEHQLNSFRRQVPGIERKIKYLQSRQLSEEKMIRILHNKAPTMLKEVRNLVKSLRIHQAAQAKVDKKVSKMESEMPGIASNIKELVQSKLQNDKEIAALRTAVPQLEETINKLEQAKAVEENATAVQLILNKKRLQTAASRAAEEEHELISLHQQVRNEKEKLLRLQNENSKPREKLPPPPLDRKTKTDEKSWSMYTMVAGAAVLAMVIGTN